MLEEVVLIAVKVFLVKFELRGQIQFLSSANSASLRVVFVSTQDYVPLGVTFSVKILFLDIQKKMVYIETDI